MQNFVTPEMCEQATGCEGAGDYAKYAEQMGYPHCIVVDWTSSAGDWCFLVSKDRKDWHMMFQENNWPSRGFTRHIEPLVKISFVEPMQDDDDVLETLCEFEGWN